MAAPDRDHIDFDALEAQLHDAVEADAKYNRENDAKFRAIHQKVATYDDFRDMVAAAHLKPLEKKDHIDDKFVQPWNILASKHPGDSSTSSHNTQLMKSDKLPKNGIEFSRDWRRSCTTSGERYHFLLSLGGQRIAEIFKPEISLGLLGDFLNCLNSELKVKDIGDVTGVLEGLTLAGRFDLSLTFLSSQERDSAEKLFGKLEETSTNDNDSSIDFKDFNVNQLRVLKEKYKITS